MDPFLDTLDTAVRELIADDDMQKMGVPSSVGDLEDCPCRSFDELVDRIREGDVKVIQGFERSAMIFSMISRPSERFFFRVGLHAPYVIGLSLVILAFLIHKYWLSLGVAFPFVATVFTCPQFPLKRIVLLGALALTSVGIANESVGITLFFGGYVACHLLRQLHRGTYTRVLFQRALALESVFVLLHSGGYIFLTDRHYRRFKTREGQQPVRENTHAGYVPSVSANEYKGSTYGQ